MSADVDGEPVVVVTRRWPAEVEQKLRDRFRRVRLNPDDRPFTPEQLHRALREADVLLPTVTDRLSAEMFDGPVRTRLLANFGAGIDHIDMAAAGAAGVLVTNTPGVLTDATADIAMLLLLMVARRAGQGEREVRNLQWSGWRPTHLLGGEVTGKTLGIIGMGRIGVAVARRAHFGFNMRVISYRGSDQAAADDWARRAQTLEEVLETADFVSLHMPGGGDNRHLIDGSKLARMKPSAYLINTARGDVVDTEALIDALVGGIIAGAGLDVYEGEPGVPERLRQLDNVVLLPHLGSATVAARTAMGMLAMRNANAFLAGQEPPTLVKEV